MPIHNEVKQINIKYGNMISDKSVDHLSFKKFKFDKQTKIKIPRIVIMINVISNNDPIF